MIAGVRAAELSHAPLMLLHAGVADRTMWREHLEPLANAGYRVIAADLPGFGEAPAPETEDAPWNDVLETMDALGIERAALVGNSFGGAVALRVALVAPARVSALALISAPPPGSGDPSPELRAAWDAEGPAMERGDVEAAVRAVVDAWTLPGAPPELRARVAEMQRRAFVVPGRPLSAAQRPAAWRRSLRRRSARGTVLAGAVTGSGSTRRTRIAVRITNAVISTALPTHHWQMALIVNSSR